NGFSERAHTSSGYTALEVYLNSLVGEHIELVGLEQTLSQQVGCYRAPGSTLLHVCAPVQLAGYVVYDLQGRVRLTQDGTDGSTIDIGTLDAGLYMLVLRTSTGHAVCVKFLR
ncbi:MAG TPA: hypothetical protein DD409_01465, partial [Bacteroidales bacterium]|nr:hypothetical protein [Bacteroidales bacterium]